MAHVAVARVVLEVGAKVSPAQHLLNTALHQAREQSVLEALMKVAYRVQLLSDPASLDPALVAAESRRSSYLLPACDSNAVSAASIPLLIAK